MTQILSTSDRPTLRRGLAAHTAVAARLLAHAPPGASVPSCSLRAAAPHPPPTSRLWPTAATWSRSAGSAPESSASNEPWPPPCCAGCAGSGPHGAPGCAHPVRRPCLDRSRQTTRRRTRRHRDLPPPTHHPTCWVTLAFESGGSFAAVPLRRSAAPLFGSQAAPDHGSVIPHVRTR